METRYRLCDECDLMEDCQQGYDGNWYCAECMAKLDAIVDAARAEADVLDGID